MSDADCTPGREPRSVAASFFHYYVSLCRIHLSLNNNKVYALLIVGLHALPNSPRILTAGLQAHISRRSYTYRVTRPIEYLRTLCT